MNVGQMVAWFRHYAHLLQQKKTYLGELDAAIGDGDHGANMVRGWQFVEQALAEFDGDIGDCFKLVGQTLTTKVGGASGLLYGTAFLRMAAVLEGKHELTLNDWPHVLQAACEGIQQRGKVRDGEKTMFDVWQPVAQAAQQWTQYECEAALIHHMATVAQQKAEQTRIIRATKGRAAYVGEHSVGHLDPGAVSTSLLFEALEETVKTGSHETAILLVSHSEQLAKGTQSLIHAMARHVTVRVAAGSADGALGTDLDAIVKSARQTSTQHLLIFFDLGSALMNAEMAVETLTPQMGMTIVDAPFVEGAFAAAMAIEMGKNSDEAVQEALKTRQEPKIQ